MMAPLDRLVRDLWLADEAREGRGRLKVAADSRRCAMWYILSAFDIIPAPGSPRWAAWAEVMDEHIEYYERCAARERDLQTRERHLLRARELLGVPHG